jgi:uncharacterized iron-regulated membrane protein
MMMKRVENFARSRRSRKGGNKAKSREASLRDPGGTGAAYRTIWRWHFYAGLFCLPFIFILSISGGIYLFRPQIDDYLDRRFDHLALAGAAQRLDAQADAALRAHPAARLKALELPGDPTDATRVRLMTEDGREVRVLVRPDTLEILLSEFEKTRFTSLIHDLHGELLIGEPGAIMVETAAAWAIVMIITGLYLWWPRGASAFGGVFYPRLNDGGRIFLRDIHGVTGFWLSLFALFFLISALPWTKVWGGSFKYLRGIVAERAPPPDWTTGPASAEKMRRDAFRDAAPTAEAGKDMHADHGAEAHHDPKAGYQAARPPVIGFDKIAARVSPMLLAEPVLITPPSSKSPNWIARSESQNRPLRASFEFDPKSFQLVKESRFSDRPLIDRVFGFGVAAHEGQLFGWPNQLLALMTALGYLTLVITSTLMWWRRRPEGVLGAPKEILPRRPLARPLIALVIILGLLLPTLGLSLLFVRLAESIIRRAFPAHARWLGLEPVRPARSA